MGSVSSNPVACSCCETCEDLGSYYTDAPTCPIGMNKSHTTVTSLATGITYTCWQCMFDFSGCDTAAGEYDNASACPPHTVAVPKTKYDKDNRPYTCYKCQSSYPTTSATSSVGPDGSIVFTG